ncbi:MAG: hypothetical protein ACM3NH_00545 [Candidatus Saccharibacteria bacterium]
MDQVIKADLFFFITSVAVITLTVLLGILLVYLILISKRLHFILGKAKTETELISEELGLFRKNIRESGFKVAHVLKFFAHIQKGKK